MYDIRIIGIHNTRNQARALHERSPLVYIYIYVLYIKSIGLPSYLSQDSYNTKSMCSWRMWCLAFDSETSTLKGLLFSFLFFF
jgi:hypothetical protein